MLIPVCRNFCSWLRSTPVAEVFALDDPIGFHKVVAFFGILPALVMHLAAHYADFVYEDETYGTPIPHSMLWTRAGLSGHVVLLCMLLMGCTSLECFRRGRMPTCLRWPVAARFCRALFTHWGSEWGGHRPAQGPSAPQIRSQRLCI